jgi:hypothetical protein
MSLKNITGHVREAFDVPIEAAMRKATALLVNHTELRVTWRP